MPLIKVEWANSEIKQFETMLINSDHIASVRVVSNNKAVPLCVIRLTTQRESLPVRATLESIEEAVVRASKEDYETPSMLAPPWAQDK